MSAPLARALFDNVAECPEELSFRRGDLMLVLRPEVPGLAGWRLCSLHGQQGIVPANRVRLLPEPGPPDPPRGRRREAEEQEVYVVPPPARPCPALPDEIYKVPRGARREGDPSELYDVPCSLPWDAALLAPYDVPPPAKPPEEEGGREEEPAPVYAAPSNLRRASALLNLYESPEGAAGGGVRPAGPPRRGGGAGGAEPRRGRGPGGAPPAALGREPLAPPPARPALPRPPPQGQHPGPAPAPPSAPPGRGAGGLGPGEGHDYEGIRLAEEYDYVHLKGTDKLQPPTLAHDPPEEAASPSPQPETPLLLEEAPPSPADTELLEFYAGQCRAHAAALLAASQALLGSAGAGQPPGAFVPHGRAVIVATHKLLFVGDALARRAASAPLRARLGAAASALGQALRGAVLSLKGAALSYPSAPAARLLGERLAQLSRQAQAFAGLLGRLAPARP